jgi:uncharacterized damage-inducible protein DinB
MTRSLLADAFGHHVWATHRVIDACRPLAPSQLDTAVAGIYGSILGTLRHLVEADTWYLFALTGGRMAGVDADEMGLDDLGAVMEANGAAWSSLLAEDLDPDAVVVRQRDDGSESHAPAGIRLAQALHHGSDHRSQVCTALTTLGLRPPEVDVWDFAESEGRLEEVPANS